MERLNEDGQWIVLMGFVVSISLFILAIVVSQSALVGQTTSESVLEFSKIEIQDLRSEVISLKEDNRVNNPTLINDVQTLSLQRDTAIINFTNWTDTGISTEFIYIHFNNGITEYNEIYEEY